MIRYPLAVLVAVLWVTSEAAAIECAIERQSGPGHWSWRMIDGKKCWYLGRPGMSKDQLRWPATTVGRNDRRAVDRTPAAAVTPDPPGDAVQADAQEDLQPMRELTFRERWPH